MNGSISARSMTRSDNRALSVDVVRMFELKVLALSAVLAAILVGLMPDGEQAMGSGKSTVRADGYPIVLPVSAPSRARAV
jgi:hypothetical protein